MSSISSGEIIMPWTGYHLCLTVVMTISGTIYAVCMKWANGLHAEGQNGQVVKFDHPFFQGTCLFMGEFLCFVMFKILYAVYGRHNDGSKDVNKLIKGNRNFNPFKLFIPAMCDVTATYIMYIGSNFISKSYFHTTTEMVIAFVVLFNANNRQIVLNNRVAFGIVLIAMGQNLVRAVNIFVSRHLVREERDLDYFNTGYFLTILAQIFIGLKIVIEEKYVSELDIPPLQAVGWEGIFGLLVFFSLHIPFYYIKVGPTFISNSTGVLKNAFNAFFQEMTNYQFNCAVLGSVLSIAAFNFAAMSITKELSCTTRVFLDNFRIIVFWSVSLLFMGQQFYWLQFLAYISIIVGMCVYYKITFTTCFLKIRSNIKYALGHLKENVTEYRAADRACETTV